MAWFKYTKVVVYPEIRSIFELVGGSSSDSEMAPSRTEDNERLCRPEKGARKDPRG